jgi:hypothetical protein
MLKACHFLNRDSEAIKVYIYSIIFFINKPVMVGRTVEDDLFYFLQPAVTLNYKKCDLLTLGFKA